MPGASLQTAEPAFPKAEIEEAFAKAVGRPPGGLSAAEAAFIAGVQEDCAVDELQGWSGADLAAAAAGFWADRKSVV